MGYADTKIRKVTTYNRLTRTREVKWIKRGKPRGLHDKNTKLTKNRKTV